MNCHICNQVIITGRDYNSHYTHCRSKSQEKPEFKVALIQHNYPKIPLSKGLFKSLYSKRGYSLLELSSIFDMPYSTLQFLLKYYKIKIRGLKDSNNSRVKTKRETTNIKKYGHVNALGKNTEPYKKRNQTVKDKYGVDNVFQLPEIIDHINTYMIETYGSLRISNPEKQKETKANWSDAFRKEYGAKISKRKKEMTDEQKSEMLYKRYKTISDNNGLNQFESKISRILTMLNISHTFSVMINRKQADFIINNTNIIIECQGDFWHANPKYYQPNDILHHPNKLIKASDLWTKDYKKVKLLESSGYRVIYIWEDSIKNKTDKELCEMVSNLLSRELHLLQQVHQP